MTRPSLFSRARLAPLALAGALALLGSACGAQEPAAQQGAQQGAQRGAAAGQAALDSVLPRADRGRYKGADSARVTIVEISDFQCPYCRQWFEQTYARLDSAYIRTGRVKLIFIHYPLPNHQQAYPASKAALCAGVQGKFWPMHDRIFATQREWSGQSNPAERFARYATELRLDAAAYRDCYENDRVAPVIVNDVSNVTGAGVQGTPTFIINGREVLNGAVGFDEMARVIDAQLAAPGAPPAGGQPAPPPAQQPGAGGGGTGGT